MEFIGNGFSESNGKNKNKTNKQTKQTNKEQQILLNVLNVYAFDQHEHFTSIIFHI